MSSQHESPAIAIARAHVEAWSNHDFDAARNGLAPRRPRHHHHDAADGLTGAEGPG